MKTMVYIFFSFFMFCAMNLNAQSPIEIDTVSLRYVNGFTNQHEIVDEYLMTNHSNEGYITWVSLEPIKNKSNLLLMREFFLQAHGDFSYLHLMGDCILDELPVNTGYSFIKKIAPGETFSYFIVKTDPESNFYSERIVLMKESELTQFLKMQLEERYFFKPSNIVLTGK